MELEEKLKIACDALRQIADSDYGPAYHIAVKALKELQEPVLNDDDFRFDVRYAMRKEAGE